MTASCVMPRAGDHDRVLGSLVDELLRDERVGDEHVARADELEPAGGDQARVAGAGADEVDGHPELLCDEAGEVRLALLVGRRSATWPTGAARGGGAPARRARAGRRSAIWSRRCWASAGEAPPVETATAIGSWRWTAGRMNEQSSGTSTTLQRSARASASRKTRRFTDVVAVAATTRNFPSRSLGAVAAADDRQAERLDLRHDLRRDDGDLGARREQALDLLERDPAAADDEHGAARQVDARHVVARRRHRRQTSTDVIRAPWRSSLTERRPSAVAIDSVYAPGPTAVSVAPSSVWPWSELSASLTSRALCCERDSRAAACDRGAAPRSRRGGP